MSPHGAKDEITIALAANGAFSRQLAVVVAGISRSASNVPHRVYVLHDGYDEALMARVGKSATGSVNLCWIDATSATLSAAQLPAYLPIATLFRLRIEELLPPTVERLIYLDTDIAVRESLSALWAHDLGDSLLAAVRDPVVPWAASPLATGRPWHPDGTSKPGTFLRMDRSPGSRRRERPLRMRVATLRSFTTITRAGSGPGSRGALIRIVTSGSKTSTAPHGLAGVLVALRRSV